MPEKVIPVTERSLIRVLGGHETCNTPFQAFEKAWPNELAGHVKPLLYLDCILQIALMENKHPTLFFLKGAKKRWSTASRKTVNENHFYHFNSTHEIDEFYFYQYIKNTHKIIYTKK